MQRELSEQVRRCGAEYLLFRLANLFDGLRLCLTTLKKR